MLDFGAEMGGGGAFTPEVGLYSEFYGTCTPKQASFITTMYQEAVKYCYGSLTTTHQDIVTKYFEVLRSIVMFRRNAKYLKTVTSMYMYM